MAVSYCDWLEWATAAAGLCWVLCWHAWDASIRAVANADSTG